MGRTRNLRIPYGMEADVDRYLVEHKIKFTDLAISGISSVIYGKTVSVTDPECDLLKTPEQPKDQTPKTIEKNVFFHPVPKNKQI